MILALILALVFAIFAVIFALQNPTVVQVSFLTYQGEWALALLILVSVGVGILIGILVMLPGVLRRAWTVGILRRKVNELEKALQEKANELEKALQAQKAKATEPATTETASQGGGHAQPQ